MNMIEHTKLASEKISLKKEVVELREKLAEFEKSAEAEDFLLSVMDEPSTPSQFKPSTVADFIEKRAAVISVGTETSKAAIKLASSNFGIGSPEDGQATHTSGSKADDDFTDWLTSCS